MRFTRLQLILLVSGIAGIAGGVFRWIMIQQAVSPLVEPYETVVEEISADYSYTPIEKPSMMGDLETGRTSLISSEGRIKVNINSSSIQELCRLPGVGPATAGRILDYRMQNGPFLRIEELDNVKGIGPKTIAKFGDQAYAGDPEPLDQAMLDNLASDASKKKKDEKTIKLVPEPCGPGRININTATMEELISLPRIGPKTAERIMLDRQNNGPFKDVNDLTRVKGIGPKTLEKMKDRICAE